MGRGAGRHSAERGDALTSTDAQGTGVTHEHYFGPTKFNASNRVHPEKLERGQASAMMVELK